MKPLLTASICLFLSWHCIAQNEFQIKIYQNTDLFKVDYSNTDAQTVRKHHELNFNRLSIALTLNKKNGLVHELELLIPEIKKSIYKANFPMSYGFKESDRTEGFFSSYSLRYELIKRWKSSAKRIQYGIGFGIQPYFVNKEYKPLVETTFYQSIKTYGTSFNLTPRIGYSLTKDITIDLSIPLKIYDLRREVTDTKNPAIPIRQQKTGSYNHVFFESAYTIRLGVGYKF